MKNTLHHLHRHIKTVHGHVKKHHRKYLGGIFGGFAVVKLFALVLGFSFVEYTQTSTFAQLNSGCELTGQYYTGEYQTGGYLTGCVTLTGYRTGGTLDDSGTLIGATRVEEESQTGCVFTGRELTGGYRTGGYLASCSTEEDESGDLVSGNGICESDDIVWNIPTSGSAVRDIIDISWNYSGADCLSELKLQLYDHNNQRIDLSTLSSGASSYVFDSRSLSSTGYSGLYHIPGTGNSGQYIYLYTGMYTGTYIDSFSGYVLRLFDTISQTGIYQTSPFTIDNQIPTITGITLLSNGSATGYLNLSGLFTLNFTASEELSGVQIILGSGISNVSEHSGLVYTNTRTITTSYPEGPIVLTIIFADIAGNTGTFLYTGLLAIDMTKPLITGFAFSGYASGLYLNFSGSEPINAVFSYQTSGGALLTGAHTEYLTSQQLSFVGIERDQLYTFMITLADRASNQRLITGDVLRTSLGEIIDHIYIVPILDQESLTGDLVSLALVLQAEVEKFNACKNNLSYTPIELTIRNNTFRLEMPLFQKSQMKTLVNAFTLFVLDKIKKNPSISSGEINTITKKFDNFLIILKLLRDDDNNCKQNLSNYHISQFGKTLEEYKINLK